MGCFVSCLRSKDEEHRIQLRPSSSANSGSHNDLESVKEELVVDNSLGSLSLNVKKEEKFSHPNISHEHQDEDLKTLKTGFICEETPMEICQLKKRIAFQELNGLDQSSKSVQTSSKTVELVAQCEEENSPDQAIVHTRSLGKDSTFCQKTPGAGSSEDTKTCKLDSPYRTAMTPDREKQTPVIISSSYKETPMTVKCVNSDLKPTQQRDGTGIIESIELGNENQVSRECYSLTKKCCDNTPAVMDSNLPEWLNGIPNTTTKYKEDQRVKWHATPFEERLERILSDERMPPPRKLVSGRLIQLEE